MTDLQDGCRSRSVASVTIDFYYIMTETWKAIAGYEGQYEVSDLGRVKSVKCGKEKILKPGKNNCGYLGVILWKDGHRKHLLVHRLVAEAFIPNPQCLGTVNHRDEKKTNNSVSNLEWMSQEENCNWGTRNKRMGEANINNPAFSKQVQMLDKQTSELLATFPSAHEASRITFVNRGDICLCCNGKRKYAGGYIWRYA